jgi:hypothetical protein
LAAVEHKVVVIGPLMRPLGVLEVLFELFPEVLLIFRTGLFHLDFGQARPHKAVFAEDF